MQDFFHQQYVCFREGNPGCNPRWSLLRPTYQPPESKTCHQNHGAKTWRKKRSELFWVHLNLVEVAIKHFKRKFQHSRVMKLWSQQVIHQGVLHQVLSWNHQVKGSNKVPIEGCRCRFVWKKSLRCRHQWWTCHQSLGVELESFLGGCLWVLI